MAVERTVKQVESTEELWETTGEGMIFLQVTGIDGKPRTVSVGGRVGQRLRISEYDRMLHAESVLDDNADPFQNGMLIRVNGPQVSDQALTEDQVAEIFTHTGKPFQDLVLALNEYNTRRLLEKADALDATNSQIQFLRATIEERWPLGGDTPMYRELKGIGEVTTATR